MNDIDNNNNNNILIIYIKNKITRCLNFNKTNDGILNNDDLVTNVSLSHNKYSFWVCNICIYILFNYLKLYANKYK